MLIFGLLYDMYFSSLNTPPANQVSPVSKTGCDFEATEGPFHARANGKQEKALTLRSARRGSEFLEKIANARIIVAYFRRWFIALVCLCAWVHSANAQNVISQPTAVSTTPPAMQEYENNNPMQVFPPSANAPALPELQPFQWGPLTLHPHVLYHFLYGNGIESSPGQQQNSIVQTVSPGILFNLGSHWSLDYTPSLTFYSSSHFRNTWDNSVNLKWGTVYNAWVLEASQSAVLTSQPTVETAAQTDQETYSTALNASYQFNNKLSLDTGLNQNFSYVGNGNVSSASVQGLTDSKVWSTMDWLNYSFWTRLNVGLGLGYGYINEAAGPDAMYEQYQGRINWRAADKISFQISGGLQDQQYLMSGASDLVTPIFSGTVQYQPFEQTRLSVTGNRTVSTSYFENQTTENTGINVDLNQRLLGELYLDLSGGYAHTKYVSSASVGQIGYGSGRTDDNYTFSARLTCPVLKRGTFSIFYQYSDNSSTQTGFANYNQISLTSQSAYSYTSSQVGFEIGYRY
jgi:hypothetical protein